MRFQRVGFRLGCRQAPAGLAVTGAETYRHRTSGRGIRSRGFWSAFDLFGPAVTATREAAASWWFRAISTRFDELAARYRAGAHHAALTLRLRDPLQDPSSDKT
ncbi:hypothetical protein [Streptomyces sp. NBC_00233]|uniref:hypothetical protein n=1 Tax=Streptomyces sp. NBC_00233 TaxID=2975686 RepID=UPI00224F094F|nr:hypothetical protein [Streptomyces sp. NBC_00233]MCX5230866.1 hypothetical protein [Streptomyces sp. NBC_00233]